MGSDPSWQQRRHQASASLTFIPNWPFVRLSVLGDTLVIVFSYLKDSHDHLSECWLLRITTPNFPSFWRANFYPYKAPSYQWTFWGLLATLYLTLWAARYFKVREQSTEGGYRDQFMSSFLHDNPSLYGSAANSGWELVFGKWYRNWENALLCKKP